MPPTKAAAGSVQKPRTSPVTVITSTAPAAAPEDRPNRKGSARSLRVVVWRRHPTMPSPAPTMIASSARGKRRSTTIRVRGDGPPSGSAPAISIANASSTAPNDRRVAPADMASNVNPARRIRPAKTQKAGTQKAGRRPTGRPAPRRRPGSSRARSSRWPRCSPVRASTPHSGAAGTARSSPRR